MGNISLENRRVLITGGTQGVGYEIARSAVEAGVSSLVICGRDAPKGEAAVEKLSFATAKVSFVPVNLANPRGAAELFSQALKTMGSVDGLVNAAGITTRGSFLDGKLEDWEQIFAINARAPFLLMQQFIRHRLERASSGTIVNVSSMNTHCGAPELAIYSASKGALSTLTKNEQTPIWRTRSGSTPSPWDGHRRRRK